MALVPAPTRTRLAVYLRTSAQVQLRNSKLEVDNLNDTRIPTGACSRDVSYSDQSIISEFHGKTVMATAQSKGGNNRITTE